MKTSNCLVIAGEKSGEDHFLSLIDDIKAQSPELHFWGVGGDTMKEKGVELLYHLKDFSTWGYTEVITKIPYYLRALGHLEAECKRRKTQYALLIDFQEFNLKLAAKLKAQGVIVFYYVAPQAWAWKSWRADKLKAYADHLFVLLNFEKPWFEQRGVKEVHWVAHPLAATYEDFLSKIEQKRLSEGTSRKLLILPGSRRAELNYLLPEFITAIEYLRKKFNLTVFCVAARHLPKELYEGAERVVDKWYTDNELGEALLEADLCLAASGTVTLTCALFAVPTVVAYKASLFNEFLFQTFVNYEGHISLANLIHQDRVFPELLQERASGYLLARELESWLVSQQKLSELMNRLQETKVLIQGELNRPGDFIGSIIKESLVH